jgi:hypothetical protein
MAGPTRGRLEGRITVPTGGWTATVGGGTATIVAGSYYAKTLLTAVGTAFASAASTTCTAVGSHGEAGTGLVTITFGSAKAIVWVSTDLRDILGFATDSASATSHVGTMQMRGVWLPNCAYKAPNGIGAWRGWRESDFRSAENAAGYVFAHMGQEKEVTELSWHAVERARVWTANETSDNTSWERFHRDCLWGVASWGTAGGPVRFYPDAADSATYVVYKVPDASMIKPQPFYADWAGGPWTVDGQPTASRRRPDRHVRRAAREHGPGELGHVVGLDRRHLVRYGVHHGDRRRAYLHLRDWLPFQ